MAFKDVALKDVFVWPRQLAGSTHKDIDVEGCGGTAWGCC